MGRPLSLAIGVALVLAGSAGALRAQLAPETLPLADLGAFRDPGPNWRVAGGAGADRARPLALDAEPGTGVLVNLPTDAERDPLVTGWEHGDMDLSLEFMPAKGSAAGVYLMGRYEVRLSDSWAVEAPSFADAGGIQQRWDEGRAEGRRGYGGHPPLQNASRAPGLWQRLEVEFEAPRFDASGRKVSNARFARVALNGVVVQENVEVTGPTRGAPRADEGSSGPLVIRGDEGPLALRDIRYSRYSGERVELSDLRYRAYDGGPMGWEYLSTAAPVREGTADAISSGLATAQDTFALAYEGALTVPATGRYRFELNLEWVDANPQFKGTVVGGGRLLVGGREVLLHAGRDTSASGEVELQAGRHPFSLTYYKSRPWTDQREITLYVEGAGVARHALHDEAAVRQTTPPGAIFVAPQVEPVVLRSFILHGDTKRTYAVSVADPLGVHYALDLAQGALLHVWRGPFVETTQMWHDRGDDQVAEPLGSLVTLPGTPALAFLPDAAAAWPDSLGPDQRFQREGYRLDENGHPTFLYRLRQVEVEDRIRPESDGATLRRELRLRTTGAAEGLHLQLARGEIVTRLPDGSWAVDDRSYYLSVPAGSPEPVVRRQNGREELVLPVRFADGAATVAYSIIW